MLINFDDLIQKYNMKINGVIHIGAHYGEEVDYYLKNNIENIVLFEPLPENFNMITSKVGDNPNILAYDVALGSVSCEMEMYVSSNERQSSSLLAPKMHLTHHPNVSFPYKTNVNVETLDSYKFSGYNFINMDVQGYELEVLKGSKETLKNIDYVYCEVNRAEVYENNAMVEEIDDFLSTYNMQRVETSWIGQIWGDAFYIKQ
jgi:FkbM family methyltransferase